MRNIGKNSRIIALTTAATVGLAASAAFSQQRVGNDGHALDASNRVGSGGYNSPVDQRPQVTSNDIIYGNVTGGREFRGPIGSGDPRAFSGPTAGSDMDRFISGSSGAPAAYTAPRNPYTPQVFYGASRNVPPPAGYVQEGMTGAYISADMTPHRMAGDTRTGQVYAGMANYRMPQPGEMTLLGGAGAGSQGAGLLVTGSPLYGIRLWDTQNAADRQFLQNFTNIGQEIQANQDAMRGSSAKIETGQLIHPDQIANPRPEPLGQPLSPVSAQVDGTGQQPVNQPLADRVGTIPQQGYQTLTAQERSPQYQQMHQRLEAFYKQQQLNDEQARRMADQQMQLRTASQQPQQNPTTPASPAQPGVAQPPTPAKPGQTNETGVPHPSPVTPTPLPSPVQVESLAEGIEAPGLASHMKRAEVLMREGKYTSAIEQYKAALVISPDNALVLIGLANAELGAGYFNPAAVHLRQAYLSDPTVAMGQFDLKKLLGSDRLDEVEGQLKTIAEKESKSSSAPFLLAFISYNTGSSGAASHWLGMAADRAGEGDSLLKLLGSYWSLNAPSTQPTTRPVESK